ncbi:MAG: PEGA domain-containing protein, partial [Bryobacteraceae bacterium]
PAAPPPPVPPKNAAPPSKPPRPPKPAKQATPPPVTLKGEKPAKKFPIWLVAVAAVVIIGAALAYQLFKPKPPPPTPPGGSTVTVNLSANLPNAIITVDNKPVSGSVALTPGPHVAEAKLDGYRTESKSFTVPANASGPVTVSLVLRPALPELQISTSLKAGKFVLDDLTPADLNDGSLTKEDIPLGDHTAKILDGAREVFSFSFRVNAKGPAVLTSALAAKDTPGVVVSSSGTTAQVYATPGAKGGISGQDLKPIPPDGLALTSLPPGTTQFQVDDGKGKPRIVPIDSSAASLLTVSLSGAPEGVHVVLTSNVPDAILVVDDRPYKRPFQDGKRILNLNSGKFRLKATHPGFQDSAEQTLEIKAGDTAVPGPLNFNLTPIVQKSTLSVSAAPPNADVFVDGTKVGSVSADGTFSADLTPGRHTVVLRKQGYEEASSAPQTVNAGETMKVSGESMKLLGMLVFHVNPAGAKISYQRDGENGTHEATNGQTVSLHAGSYQVGVEADGFQPKTESYIVTAGKQTAVDITLLGVPKPPIQPTTPATVFQDPASWKIGPSGWWEHPSTGYSFLRENKGVFNFDILKQSQKGNLFHKGPRKVMFVVDYHSDKDRILYTIDDHQLHRKVYSQDGDSSDNKVPHGMEAAAVYRITVDIEPDHVIVKNASGKILDEVKRTSPGGKFGFLDDVSLVLTGNH